VGRGVGLGPALAVFGAAYVVFGVGGVVVELWWGGGGCVGVEGGNYKTG
jgi:hypothetical protein